MTAITNKKTSISFIIVLIMILTLIVPSQIGNVDIVNANSSQQATVDLSNITGLIEIYNDPANENVLISNGGIVISSGPTVKGALINQTPSTLVTEKNIIIKGNGTKGIVNVILDNVVLVSRNYAKSPIKLSENVFVNMMLQGNNHLRTDLQSYVAALEVATPNAIKISGYNGEVGTLTASANSIGGIDNPAAIGGSYSNGTKDCGAITITTGASISATSINPNAFAGAGIGGTSNGNCSSITILGGQVTASSNYSAGIGSGRDGNCSNITISGGIVNASSTNGAGIGGGEKGDASSIEITGGDITAHGQVGIGAGNNSHASDIKIYGGNISATAIGDGAGIGAGYQGSASGIYIYGGNINASTLYGAGIGGGSEGEGKDINIYGGNVNTISERGSGIGGGKKATGSGIHILGGFVTAVSTGAKGYDTFRTSGIGSSGYVLGSTNIMPVSSDITIKGGSVVAKGSLTPISITPTGFSTAEPLKKVDIPVGNGINIGNQRLEIGIAGTSYIYKAKTVSAGEACEHGQGYTSAATVYLPEGTHTLKVPGQVEGHINVNSLGEASVTTKPIDNTTPGNSNETTKQIETNTTSIKSAQKNIYLKKGQKITLPIVEYTNTGKKTTLKYSSSKKKIVTVTQKGKITAKKKGKSIIKVTGTNGKSYKFNVYVSNKTVKTKKIKVSYPKTIKVKGTKFLKVTISPKKATKAVATFSSNKKSVLTVDKAGKITAKGKGKAKITVKAGGKKKVISITVK